MQIYRNNIAVMLLTVIAVLALTIIFYAQSVRLYLSAAFINTIIIGVFVFSIAYAFWSVLKVLEGQRVFEKIKIYKQSSASDKEGILTPLIRYVRAHSSDSLESSLDLNTTNSILDAISTRMHEVRDVGRYASGILILLGLLGTFIGLMDTLFSINEVISGLSLANTNNVSEALATLKEDLASPLSGMAKAFSSSLLGLGGSLVLGFLMLQLNSSLHKLYRNVEQWLLFIVVSVKDKVGFTGDKKQELPYNLILPLLSKITEDLREITPLMTAQQEEKTSLQNNLNQLSASISTLNENLNTIVLQQSKMLEQTKLSEYKIVQSTHDTISTMLTDKLDKIQEKLALLNTQNNTGSEKIVEVLSKEFRLLGHTIATVYQSNDKR